LLEINKVTKRFGGLTAVHQVSLQVRQGEILGLIGPNGAGKTTFFNLITGLYHPDEGKLFFENQEITRYQPHQIARQGIFRTFQNIRLLKERSVLDNVKIGMFRKTRAGVLKSILGLRSARQEEQWVDEMSMKLLAELELQDFAHTEAGNLSYGNQRRVEIARALVSQPKMLLLDEPTAGMNAREVQEISELIQQIRAQGTTVVLIEHNVGMVVDLCDRLAVLDHGEKIADGPPKQVIENPKVIESYIGQEADEEVVDIARNS
jgi:branched-chain amino acid transport system ATP-binding protein